MIFPCTNCVCVPICRNKDYLQIFRDCTLIEDYIQKPSFYHHRNQRRLEQLFLYLQPVRWELYKDSSNSYSIVPRNRAEGVLSNDRSR